MQKLILDFGAFITLAGVVAAEDYEVRGGIVASHLKLLSLGAQGSSLIFGNATHQIQLSGHPTDGFVIQTPEAVLASFQPDGHIILSAEQCTIHDSLDIQGAFLASGVPQWRMTHSENFSSKQAFGWDNSRTDLVTQCAGIYMLGGYNMFSKGEISKSLENLPEHSEVRVRANFHFIDAWNGESGFMRASIGKDGSLVHVWTDSAQQTDPHGINVCGGPATESKFSVPIDVVFPHSTDALTIAFGSTIEADDPTDVSWGISGLELYVR